MFKFAFVRNPWDRLYSAYRFMRRGGWGEGDALWAQAHLGAYESFSHFVEVGLRIPRVLQWLHFRPQMDFLSTLGTRRLQLDFLGYFENLEDDFRLVASRLGGSHSGLRHDNRSRQQADVSYQDAYSDETRKVVAAVYAEDIAMFGYDFENAALEEQLTSRPSPDLSRIGNLQSAVKPTPDPRSGASA
jgi:hypothetical protein